MTQKNSSLRTQCSVHKSFSFFFSDECQMKSQKQIVGFIFYAKKIITYLWGQVLQILYYEKYSSEMFPFCASAVCIYQTHILAKYWMLFHELQAWGKIPLALRQKFLHALLWTPSTKEETLLLQKFAYLELDVSNGLDKLFPGRDPSV